MRLKLCSMLLTDPDFLFLDEPTNYLDLRTLLFLETFLRTFRGGYMVISHDREFLKRTCRHTMDVDRGQIHLFPGPVEAYLAYRREQLEQIEKHNKNVEARRQELQEFVNRFKAKASKAAQAQSKMKMIEKLHTIEIQVAAKTMRLRIPGGEKRGGAAVRVRNLRIGYPDKVVADDIDFEVKRGDHIAVLGDNGQGKSTLLKTLAGSLAALSGDVQWGFEIKIGYYAQHVYEELKGKNTVLEYLDSSASKGTKTQDIMDLAGAMLFQGNDVKKSVDVLSGGEKSRLSLAGILLGRPDVLLLDEPTNHLDFETVEVLGAALRDFPGTIFFVSHDRTFVQLVASTIVEVAGGKARLYPGTYEEYVYRLEMEAGEGHKAAGKMKGDDAPHTSTPKAGAVVTSAAQVAQAVVPDEKGNADNADNTYARRKAIQADAAKARDEVKKLDKDIAAGESEKAAIMTRVNAGNASREDYVRLDALGKLLASYEERWLALQAVLEQAKTVAKSSEK
ncbi:MAG: ATP-binding cassette domain-containing protein [Spirochaetia bacterium]|nr:ATP-binding cassette domain-containing protein [Spirochaetia bacterium]